VIASQTRAAAATRDWNNRLFAAFLGSVLIVFLVAVALVLFSNVWWLAGARDLQGCTGCQVFLQAVRDPEVHFAVRLSLVSAALTTVLALLVAIPSAYALSRFRFRGGKLIDTVLDLPIVIPPPVLGMSLLMLFKTPAGDAINALTPAWLVHGLNLFLSVAAGHTITDDGSTWVYTARGIVVAQFFVVCSLAVRAVKASFDTVGSRHEDVARTLGCTRRQAFVRVVLPMATSGIVAGAVMSWARAIAEFGPILFFCSSFRWKTEVMPISMFLYYSAGRIEKAVALVIIMVLISTVTLLTFKKLGGQGYLW
jgi:molybdate transport system permease protein